MKPKTLKRLLIGLEYRVARAAALHKGTNRTPPRGNESVESLLRGVRRGINEIRDYIGLEVR